MSVIVFLIVLSILVVVHEWGHYITAVKLGVKVEKFSIGFGKKLWSRQSGDTEFMISAIPLGGYVKMAGDERDQCTGNPEEFFSQPIWRRALIVVMGPVINVVFAYFCIYVLCVTGYPNVFTGMEPHVAWVKDGSPAAAAGIQPGDEILTVDGRSVFVFEDVRDAVKAAGGEPLSLTWRRGDEVFSKSIRAERMVDNAGTDTETVRWVLGVLNYQMPAAIGEVIPNGPAARAGIREGDLVVAIDGRPVESFRDMQTMVRDSGGRPLSFRIDRSGQDVEMTITPESDTDEEDGGGAEWFIQVAPPAPPLERYGVLASFGVAAEQMSKLTRLTFREFGKVLTGRKDAKDSLAGPIRIFSIVTGAWHEGMTYLTFIMGIISLNLAIFNLLPIPVLDGGHLFFFALEGVRRRPLPLKIEDFLTRIGMGMLLGLLVFVSFQDILAMGWVDHIKRLISGLGS